MATIDDRFPAGEWTGFYLLPITVQRYGMDLVLQFTSGRISGSGSDPVGNFAISGAYDPTIGDCSWTKQYIGKHGVDYVGRAYRQGITGEWNIPGEPAFWSGPFFIWPRESSDCESEFEKAFLEYELAKTDS